MTTSSYASLFGTNGAGAQTPRVGNLFGQQATQSGSTQQRTPTYQQTFAQMQQQGVARPAPPPPQAGTYQTYGGSGQAQAARAPMLQSIQQQLANPTRFDTAAFNQIRTAQQGNLNAEFGAQRSQLEEEMARRGLSASSIGAGRYGDLAGQQARASATLDADLLSQAAQTQSQDRLASLQAAGQFADLAGSQDLAQFEANRVGQAQRFQEQLASANFGQGQSEFDRGQALQAANLEQTGGLSGLDLALRQQLGLGNLGLDAARLDQEGAQFGQNLGLNQQRLAQEQAQFQSDVQLRTQQLMQQAQLEGRSLDLTQARQQAEQGLEQQRIANQNQQFGQNLGLDRERMAVQNQQFGQTLQEQMAQRMQQGQQFGQQIGLDSRRLDAQNQQFGQDLALRTQQLQQEAALQGRSLTLQEAQAQAQREQFTQSQEQQQGQFGLEQELRRTLGMGDLDVRRQQATADTQMAQNQLFLQLAQALGGLSPAMIQSLFGGQSRLPDQTLPPVGGTGVIPPNGDPNDPNRIV